jgi:hypothetical protein
MTYGSGRELLKSLLLLALLLGLLRPLPVVFRN